LPKETAPKPNFLAPQFSLAGLDDQTYSVGGQRDKPIFLNFWASWCNPCEIEAPELKRLHDKYGEKIDFYAVNMTQYDKLANVRAFAERFGFDFPILLDTEGEAADLYNIIGIPTSFIIDKNGVIVDAFNLLNPDELEKRVKRAVSGS
jgi:thiol-disulfide isomerase/thioredoxin